MALGSNRGVFALRHSHAHRVCGIVVLLLAAFFSWIGCGGGASQSASTSSPVPPTTPAPPTTPPGGIPVEFFGLHVLDLVDFPARVPYGEFRNWDTEAQWPQLEPSCGAASGSPSDPCFVWTNFDQETADLHTAGINNILYTLSRVPPWASSNPSDAACNGTPTRLGECDLPTDINADGSGTNQTWKNWVTALASHANGLDDPTGTYNQTHAHVKYWEPWNEWYRDPLVSDWPGTLSVRATYAQMLRLTEDVRCIITGKGVIHNYPSAGSSTPCTQTPIDPNALITTPSGAAQSQYVSVTPNFLYCNDQPFPGSNCTWGSGLNWGSQAVDIIDFHLYAISDTPEAVVTSELPAVRSLLNSTDLAKPLWDGESSWGVLGMPNNIWNGDAYARAGFIPRMIALYWSAGVSQIFFYSYEGFLFQAGSFIEPEAQAWITTYNWLADAVPAQNPFCQTGQFGFSSTVYTCPLTESSGTAALLIWDSQFGPGGTVPMNCTTSTTPLLCGSTSITVPSKYGKDWVDVGGTVHAASTSVTIGANPILLEAP